MHAPAGDEAPPEKDDARDWLEDNAAGDVVLTPDGVLLEYNRAAARMFRLASDADAHGMNVLGLCTDVPRFHEAIRALELTGRLESWDCDFVRFDGAPLHAIINLVGNFDQNRQLASVRAHLFNITEWRKLQQRSADRDRLDAVGRLAGGIAHDFNNLMMIVLGHADLLAEHHDPDVVRSAAAIHEAASRATTVTRQLLAFGRREVLRVQAVDLNVIAVSVQADIRRTFGRRVHVELSLDRGLWPVRVDPKHFELAVDTLVGHAIDTMAQEGALSLRTSNVERAAEQSVPAGSYVQLEIAHTGRPLDAETRARLFEPFNGPSAQSRMDLAAVYGFVKQSGGYIWVEEAQSHGTRFMILVPVLERRSPPSGAPHPERHRNDAVLLVDDDEDVRTLVGQTLRSQGFTVLDAADAGQAMAAFDSYRGTIQVLIADVMLASGSGIDLAKTLTAKAPDLRVLLISGYSDHAGAVAEWKERGDFLEKPFTLSQLMDRLTKLLRAR
jgi:signal transduction histidine kinase/CheY-like chemotaxis protein